jgi:hypothetical protein
VTHHAVLRAVFAGAALLTVATLAIAEPVKVNALNFARAERTCTSPAR